MKSYFKYFRIPFIIAAVITIASLAVYLGARSEAENAERNNSSWDNTCTVLDYAGKMTDYEVESLSDRLYEIEQATQTDIVFLIIEDAENGYLDSVRRIADAFSEDNHMGFDYPGGSAIVFVDNWSRGGDGKIHSWMSTTGLIRERISDTDAEEMLNVLDELTSDDEDPYYVYSKLAKKIYKKGGVLVPPYSAGTAFLAALVIAVIYIVLNWRSKLGDVTVNERTYLEGGSANFTHKSDTFTHKTVTKHKIERSSSSGGGGGGGSHGGGGHSR